MSKFKICQFPLTTLGQELSSGAYLTTLTGLWCPVTEITQWNGSLRLGAVPA